MHTLHELHTLHAIHAFALHTLHGWYIWHTLRKLHTWWTLYTLCTLHTIHTYITLDTVTYITYTLTYNKPYAIYCIAYTTLHVITNTYITSMTCVTYHTIPYVCTYMHACIRMQIHKCMHFRHDVHWPYSGLHYIPSRRLHTLLTLHDILCHISFFITCIRYKHIHAPDLVLVKLSFILYYIADFTCLTCTPQVLHITYLK